MTGTPYCSSTRFGACSDSGPPDPISASALLRPGTVVRPVERRVTVTRLDAVVVEVGAHRTDAVAERAEHRQAEGSSTSA